MMFYTGHDYPVAVTARKKDVKWLSWLKRELVVTIDNYFNYNLRSVRFNGDDYDFYSIKQDDNGKYCFFSDKKYAMKNEEKLNENLSA